jgi:selenocysteine lyase/cysteine desulfurase
MSFDVDALRRTEFPSLLAENVVYLNNASTGPLPRRTVETLDDWARHRAVPHRISQEMEFGTLDVSRQLIAELIGAHESEIAVATNTTFGLNLAAFSLPLKSGDVVLSPDLEFPANVYPWMQLAARRGVEYRRLRCDGPLDVARLTRELEDERVRVVTVSWVQFASGARVDLAALGTLCRERNVYFVVDAIQGLGPLTLDLASTPVDILACGAQKWLLSPWGSGFVYVRRELVQQLQPHDVSWLAVKGSDDFTRLTNYDLTWRDDARRFEFVTLPYQEFAAMNATLELIQELGAANVAAYSQSLADRIVEWACARGDVKLLTPTKRGQYASIVSVCPPDAAAASARLSDAGVVHSFREGGVRLSPYFYNTVEEIERTLGIIGG